MHNPDSPNDNDGLRAAGQDGPRPVRPRPTSIEPPDAILFGQVQRWVERTADELVRDVLRSAITPDGGVEHRDAIAGRRAEVELVGVQAFARARRLHADDHREIPWEAHALKMMRAKIVEIFGDGATPSNDQDVEGGEGTGGAPLPRPTRPSAPGGGEARVQRRGGRTTTRLGSVRRHGLLRSRTELAMVAERIAIRHVSAVIGSWADDSEAVDHVARSAAARGLDRWERLWDPEKGSLLGYLSDCVKSEVRDGYRDLCTRKSHDSALRDCLEDLALDEVRSQVYEGGAHDVHDVPAGSQLERILAAVDDLSERQRAAVLRRLDTDDPGSAADSNAYSRALGNLRMRLARPDHADCA